MITQIDVMNAINEELITADSNVKAVYTQFCPKDFERPCHYIEPKPCERSAAGAGLNYVQMPFLIVSYVETDERHLSDYAELLQKQAIVSGIFEAGFLKVGDRSLSVSGCKCSDDGEAAFTEIALNFFDDAQTADIAAPNIQTIGIKIENEV